MTGPHRKAGKTVFLTVFTTFKHDIALSNTLTVVQPSPPSISRTFHPPKLKFCPH
jgi:hypothetical protein